MNTTNYLKTLLPLIFSFTLAFLPLQSVAQSFEDGLELYENGKFAEAAKLFSQIDSEEGRLFAGKSYFATGEYVTAKSYLNSVTENDDDLFLEAQYTLALTEFQLDIYDEALKRLYELMQTEPQTRVIFEAGYLYKDILEFLTISQRKNAFKESDHPEIKYDLVSSAFDHVEYPVAKTLYEQLVKAKIDTTTDAMRKLSDLLADSTNFYSPSSLKAPKGITYNLGAALPSYPPTAPEFEISQGLYFGYVLAAEEFNQTNRNKKAFIRYGNTGTEADSVRHVMTNFSWNVNIDAVLGPLFSSSAIEMASLAEEYQIPMLAPLANSDTLNFDNPYVYQANPTFGSHGRRMARHAVSSLGFDTLAVIAEKETLGANSAFTFREEAEKLGAKVSYFFVEDLASKGYELTDYTKYFTADSVARDSLNYANIDAIYAPFTGQAANTLVKLLLTDLEAANSSLPILGSQQWKSANITDEQLKNRNIYFTESFYIDEKSQRVEQFKEAFKRRFDTEPNRYAMIGYDTASFILRTLTRVENPALLKNALKREPLYEGVISDISFDNTHINQQVKVFELKADSIRPYLESVNSDQD